MEIPDFSSWSLRTLSDIVKEFTLHHRIIAQVSKSVQSVGQAIPSRPFQAGHSKQAIRQAVGLGL
jgi:hypothetical protein